MKMVKSLLLGSAAGLIAVTAGQAADLPVKAKPIEYLKICSLYGAGFYYMPGTDLCIKIGGYVRAEATYGGNGNITWGPFNANQNNRTTSNEIFRARGYLTADARSQSEYGTVRSYLAVGLSTNDTGLQVASLVDNANRAFIQWAGMTAGLSQSFYDYYSVVLMQYRGGYLPASDTGDGGWFVWAYTAQFGNGWSATIAEEARRTTQIIDHAVPGAAAGSSTGGTVTPGSYTSVVAGGAALFPGNGAYGGQQAGDVVGNLRLDQTWGGFQLMAAAHEVNATYYTPATPGSGHPGNTWGWAAGAGVKFNLPMIAQGDVFQAQFNYTEGALRYLFQAPNTNFGAVRGAGESYGVLSDCVYGGAPAGGTATGCQLTTAYGINVGYDHFWVANWHTSLVGAYIRVQYNASANAMLCGLEGNGTGVGSTAVAGVGCNNNWTVWGISSRTQWDVTKNTYIGVEVVYENLQSATLNSLGTLLTTTGAASPVAFGAATQQRSNQNNLAITLRFHRDFLL